MIRFDNGKKCFNYRIVGVAVHKNQVLLHRAEDENFWTFPGGRAELGEPAVETLKREMLEELGIEVEIIRLLWFVENFFTYAGKDYHEIALYFLMRLPADSSQLVQPTFQGDEEGVKLIFQWFPQQADVLSRLPLLPSFLQTAIETLPESVQHILHYD